MTAPRRIVWVLVAGLVPSAAFSQSVSTGRISGVVRDTSGAVLPSVTVEASSPALIERVRVAGLISLISAVAAAAQNQGLRTESPAAQDLLQLDDERCVAISTNDFARLAELLGDDLVHVHLNGLVQGKADFLAASKARPSTSRRGANRHVRFYGSDVAVMTGTEFKEFASGGPQAGTTLDLMVTQVWVRRNGSWQEVSFQATATQPPVGR